jgi:phosphoglycolate phosphatase
MRRLVLFDIDGTLLHSHGAGRRALLAAMADLLPEPERLRGVRFDGKTDPQIVIELLAAAGVEQPDDRARVEQVLDRYVSHLERELARPDHRTEVLPGVPALLDRLEADAAATLGLLTGNVQPGARLKLASADIDPGRFPVGAFGSDHADRAELPAIAAHRARSLCGHAPRGADLVIVGDTPADVTCGLALGARAIGVATGSYSSAELREAGAWAVLERLDPVEDVWEAIWG